MAFCKNCGAQLNDGASFCNKCGAPVAAAEGTAYQPAPAPVAVNPNEFTEQFPADERDDCRILAALMYVFIPALFVALLIRPNSKFIKFHVNQVLVLYVACFFASLTAIVPFLGWAFAPLALLVLEIFAWIGFARALGRRACYLPLIGKYKIFDYNK